MAPEQLEGKEADARTDLWALGAILYEMLTGKRAFAGDSEVSLIGNIMNAEPASLATAQPLTPPSLDRVVTKCLAKHPDGRWDSARDVADELRWVSQTSGASSLTGVQPSRRGWLRTALEVVGGLAMALAGAGAMWLLRPDAPHSSPARVSLDLRPVDELNAGGVDQAYSPTLGGSRTALAWAPDGQALIFVGRRGESSKSTCAGWTRPRRTHSRVPRVPGARGIHRRPVDRLLGGRGDQKSRSAAAR